MFSSRTDKNGRVNEIPRRKQPGINAGYDQFKRRKRRGIKPGFTLNFYGFFLPVQVSPPFLRWMEQIDILLCPRIAERRLIKLTKQGF